jgi:hypothetical protein
MTKKLLTIGMATYDDYDGVYFTIQSLRMYHDICNTDQVEFVVVDNNPTSKHGVEVKDFINNIKGKYIANDKPNASWTKYQVPDYANGKYIIIMDCHVLLIQNAIQNLLEYYTKNPECKNLIQGPMLSNSFNHINTHWNPEWRGHMYGSWANDQAAFNKGEPFSIPMQGMACMSFEKSCWHGINSHFRNFGGEQGYIAEKFRSWGGDNICLPSFQWVHRFGRPNGVPFQLWLEDRVWNYFIGWLDLYNDPDHKKVKETYNHFKDKIPPGKIDEILSKAIKEYKT